MHATLKHVTGTDVIGLISGTQPSLIMTLQPNSDDTSQFQGLFLVPVGWYQKLVSLSYFSGARNRRQIENVQFHAGNQLESWTVIGQSEQTIALLAFFNKNDR